MLLLVFGPIDSPLTLLVAGSFFGCLSPLSTEVASGKRGTLFCFTFCYKWDLGANFTHRLNLQVQHFMVPLFLAVLICILQREGNGLQVLYVRRSSRGESYLVFGPINSPLTILVASSFFGCLSPLSSEVAHGSGFRKEGNLVLLYFLLQVGSWR